MTAWDAVNGLTFVLYLIEWVLWMYFRCACFGHHKLKNIQDLKKGQKQRSMQNSVFLNYICINSMFDFTIKGWLISLSLRETSKSWEKCNYGNPSPLEFKMVIRQLHDRRDYKIALCDNCKSCTVSQRQSKQKHTRYWQHRPNLEWSAPFQISVTRSISRDRKTQ